MRLFFGVALVPSRGASCVRAVLVAEVICLLFSFKSFFYVYFFFICAFVVLYVRSVRPSRRRGHAIRSRPHGESALLRALSCKLRLCLFVYLFFAALRVFFF